MAYFSFITIGIILMLYSLAAMLKIYGLIANPKIKHLRIYLISLIAIFTIGYLLLFVFSFILPEINVYSSYNILVSLILFLGSIFVALNSKIFLLTMLNIKTSQAQLQENYDELKKSQKELLRQKAEMEKINSLIIDRELKMIELKNKNIALETELKKQPNQI